MIVKSLMDSFEEEVLANLEQLSGLLGESKTHPKNCRKK
jgi:hypothetical protein